MTNPKKLKRCPKGICKDFLPIKGPMLCNVIGACPCHSQPKGGKCPKGCLWPHQPEHWHYKDSPANLPTGQVGHPADEGKEGWHERLEKLALTEPDPNQAIYNLPRLKGFISSLLKEEREKWNKNVEKIICKHNANILNEFQLQAKPDLPLVWFDEKVVLIPAIEKAMESLPSILKTLNG